MSLPSNLAIGEANPDWLNKGDNAWQLTAATLVGLQSIPGLVILYGSIVKKKWAVNSAFMALYAFASVLICWVIWAFEMSFGERMLPFWGKPNFALGQSHLLEQDTAFSGMFPRATLVYFQFVFAAITLILVAGSLLGRMNFHAWMFFVPLWLTFSYSIGAFSIWSPAGFLFKKGIIDFCGGYVIHLSAGVAGFTCIANEIKTHDDSLLKWTVGGLYWLRHPVFRDRMPAPVVNFFRRLPALSDRII